MFDNIRKKVDNFMKNLTIFVVFFISYMYIPSLIAYPLYKNLHLSEYSATLIGDLGFLILLIIIFYKMFKEKIKDYISNFPNYFRDSLKYWGIGLLVMAISNIILNVFIFPGEIATNEELNRIFIESNVVVGFILVVLVAPFIEEMIFRFALRKVTGRVSIFPLISALLFGLPHALTGINSLSDLPYLLYVIPYGALGYAFGYLYNKTDNIFCSTLMHMLHNFVCFVLIMMAM